jgi:parvulin-like peptidyl-prolyl isomerase
MSLQKRITVLSVVACLTVGLAFSVSAMAHCGKCAPAPKVVKKAAPATCGTCPAPAPKKAKPTCGTCPAPKKGAPATCGNAAAAPAAAPVAAPAAPKKGAPAAHDHAGHDHASAPKAPVRKMPPMDKMLPLPPKMPAVAATVGKTNISGDEINAAVATARQAAIKQFAQIPDQQKGQFAMYIQQQLATMPTNMRNQKIFQALLDSYVTKKKIVAAPADIEKIKTQIAAAAKQQGVTVAELMKKANITDAKIQKQAQTAKLVETTLSDKNVAAFIAKNPAYFNGTKVQAQHILLKCEGTAATAEHKKAIAKLEKIAADLKAGKGTFAEAAKADSVCPSGKKKGGDLGEFTFSQMVPPFSIAAFNTKPGEVAPIVRTNFGYHLIKSGKRVEGKEAVDPKNEKTIELAKNIMMAQVMNDVLDQALTTCPVTYPKAPAAAKTN